MELPGWPLTLLLIADLGLRIALSIRVIMRRQSTATTFSWLILILTFPFVGAATYFLIGENRLGVERARREKELMGPYAEWRAAARRRLAETDWAGIPADSRRLAREAESLTGAPAMEGNKLELIEDSVEAFRRICCDIENARSSAHLLFYIWCGGGEADRVVEALERAAQRGVRCRVLVDEIGSREWLRSSGPSRLRAAGVEVVAALPTGVFRSLFVRMDLRNHRKAVVIDGEIGYTGSLNVADPRLFRADLGIGRWIDVFVRMEGPIVEQLALVFLFDWELETGEGVTKLAELSDVRPLEPRGEATAQVIVSGPGAYFGAAYHNFLSAIYMANQELVLTTPYFVPDDAVRAAMIAAVRRGVRVSIIIPERVDAKLVAAASRAHFLELLDAGVTVGLFKKGLLHTKAVTVDAHTALISTANLDQRSFFLNFEITLAVYDRAFTAEVRAMQMRQLEEAEKLDAAAWRRRPFHVRLLEDATMLLAPLL